ncbi:SagB/ThcOx family dehydrogenase [Achromobacter arsenitoxydans]|nr:SagB/ThcOx family dehydrogenase [Achromobacter arsenitoxydans]
MTDPSDAPLFKLFWQNGELNPTRAALLGRRIAADAVRPSGTPAPRHGEAAQPLPDAPADEARRLARRESSRRFGAAPVALEELGRLLHPLRAHVGQQNRLLPSGGGKYPLHVYVALRHVGMPSPWQGRIAWYDSASHGLVPVGNCPAWPALADILGVDWPEPPAAVVFMIGRPETILAKYGERGGRFLLIEAGVYLGALGQQAADMGWSGCAIGSFHDQAVLGLLELDASRHLAVLAYACGPRDAVSGLDADLGAVAAPAGG